MEVYKNKDGSLTVEGSEITTTGNLDVKLHNGGLWIERAKTDISSSVGDTLERAPLYLFENSNPKLGNWEEVRSKAAS